MGRGAGEETGTRENGSRSSATLSSSSCLVATSAWREGSLFSLQHKKGSVGRAPAGRAGLQPGGQGSSREGRAALELGTQGEERKRPGRPRLKEMGKNEESRSQEGWGDASPGDA